MRELDAVDDGGSFVVPLCAGQPRVRLLRPVGDALVVDDLCSKGETRIASLPLTPGSDSARLSPGGRQLAMLSLDPDRDAAQLTIATLDGAAHAAPCDLPADVDAAGLRLLGVSDDGVAWLAVKRRQGLQLISSSAQHGVRTLDPSPAVWVSHLDVTHELAALVHSDGLDEPTTHEIVSLTDGATRSRWSPDTPRPTPACVGDLLLEDLAADATPLFVEHPDDEAACGRPRTLLRGDANGALIELTLSADPFKPAALSPLDTWLYGTLDGQSTLARTDGREHFALPDPPPGDNCGFTFPGSDRDTLCWGQTARVSWARDESLLSTLYLGGGWPAILVQLHEPQTRRVLVDHFERIAHTESHHVPKLIDAVVVPGN